MVLRPRQKFRQLALPFPRAELHQPVTPTELAQPAARALPPGLKELAEAESLDDNQVRQLAEAWPTIRGRKPTTVEEWRPLYEAIKKFVLEVNSHADSQT